LRVATPKKKNAAVGEGENEMGYWLKYFDALDRCAAQTQDDRALTSAAALSGHVFLSGRERRWASAVNGPSRKKIDVGFAHRAADA
jgi:hypothetical protein